MATHNINITLDGTLITDQSAVTPVAGDFLLLSDTSDSGDLKKVDASDFLGGGTDHASFLFFHVNNYSFPDGVSAKFSVITSVAPGVIYTLRPLPAGTIKAVYTQVGSNSTIASSEDCVLKIITNDGADSFTVATDFKLNANRTLYQEYTGLSEAVTAGGAYIQIEVPTLATNPLATTVRVEVLMEL